MILDKPAYLLKYVKNYLHIHIPLGKFNYVILTEASGRKQEDKVLRRLPAQWLVDADVSAPISSNQPSLQVPFQRWFKFKEAFSPRFIIECIQSMDRYPKACLDPFGGSGTTALTCQLLGVRPTTIEVNPFLADLISSKLHTYNLNLLERDYLRVLERVENITVNPGRLLRGGPPTLIEPGTKERWIYSKETAKRILAIRESINAVCSDPNRVLLLVVLGSILVPNSNVRVNGKGRKYRRNWALKQKAPSVIDVAFREAFLEVYADLVRFSKVKRTPFSILRGDSRKLISQSDEVDIVIFSPPYPNSFDYTDIYNIELWMLGYLNSWDDNKTLRNETVRSHVQVKRDFSSVDHLPSRELKRAYKQLCEQREVLWDRHIPEMVVAYFDDMRTILTGVRQKLKPGGKAFLAVGNSKYAGVMVDTAKIITQLAPSLCFNSCRSEAIRSMRSSAQQGGNEELNESLIILS